MTTTQTGMDKLAQRENELLDFCYAMEVILHEFSHALYKDFDETVERIEAKKQEFKNFEFSLAELTRSAKDIALTNGMIRHFYLFDNFMATYVGTQLMCFIHACYDLMKLKDKKTDKKILTSDEKNLQILLQKEQPIHKSRIPRDFKTKKEAVLLLPFSCHLIDVEELNYMPIRHKD